MRPEFTNRFHASRPPVEVFEAVSPERIRIGWSQMLAALKAWTEHGINRREGAYM